MIRHRPSRARMPAGAVWLAASMVPLLIRLVWSALVATPGPSLPDCATLLSPIARARALEAAVVIAVIAVLAVLLRADRASLSLRLPGLDVTALSLAALVVMI